MTQEEYLKALAGLSAKPKRHYRIGGRKPRSITELDKMACSAGIKTGIPTEPEDAGEEAAADLNVDDAETTPATVEAEANGSESAVECQAPDKEEANPVAEMKPSRTSKKPKVEAGSGKTPKPKADKSAPPDAETTPATVEIPENLGTLRYNELQELAAKLGISPVPTVQPELVAAIEAKRG